MKPIFKPGTRLIAICKTTTVEGAAFAAGQYLGTATGKQKAVDRLWRDWYIEVNNERLGYLWVLDSKADKDTAITRAEAAFHHAMDTGEGVGEALDDLYKIRGKRRQKD